MTSIYNVAIAPVLLWEERDLSEILTMEAERGTLKKKIFFTEAAFQSRFSKDVALKDCL